MPSLITHVAPALALGIGLGPQLMSKRLLAASVAVSLVPDLDSIGYFMGVPYEAVFGHRGLSHSLGAAFAAGFLGFALGSRLHAKRWLAALIFFGCYTTHILLDAMTSGGLGVALFWPFSEARYFLPFRPIRVSPMGLSGLSVYSFKVVMLSEMMWVWGPFLGAALALRKLRKLYRLSQ